MSAEIVASPKPDERLENRPRRLSEELWGIEWARHLPVDMGDGIVATESSLEQALPFIQAHYAEIFEESPDDERFWREPMTDARVRYYRRVGDFFEFKREGRTVGLLIGTPVDWSTYYVRSGAVLKACQGFHLPQRLVRMLCEWLAPVGVSRVEAETAPSNLGVIQTLTRLRFNVSGTVLSDRWGVMLRLTKFLDPGAEQAFLRQYCSGVHYQLRERGGSRETTTERNMA